MHTLPHNIRAPSEPYVHAVTHHVRLVHIKIKPYKPPVRIVHLVFITVNMEDSGAKMIVMLDRMLILTKQNVWNVNVDCTKIKIFKQYVKVVQKELTMIKPDVLPKMVAKTVGLENTTIKLSKLQ